MLEPKLIDNKYVEIAIDEKFANKHGETLENIYYNRQFNASVIDELCKIAREKYDLEFDNDGSELQNIYPKGNKLIIVGLKSI